MILENLSPDEIIEHVANKYPEIDQLLFDANIYCHKYKGSMQPYQAACLYYLAKDYNHCDILEVGTGVGYSTFFLASAAPQANIVTLNPNVQEWNIASKIPVDGKVHFVNLTSREWFSDTSEMPETYDFIFVDADHRDIKFDVNWYNRLNNDGLILFHDYSNSDSKSPCLPVWNELTTLTHSYGDFDIKIVDNINFYGMAGWIK